MNRYLCVTLLAAPVVVSALDAPPSATHLNPIRCSHETAMDAQAVRDCARARMSVCGTLAEDIGYFGLAKRRYVEQCAPPEETSSP